MNKAENAATDNVKYAEDLYLESKEELTKQYQAITRVLINDVNAFFADYDLSDPYDMYKTLSNDELKQFRQTIIKTYELARSNELLKQLKTYSSKKRIHRIESLLLEFAIKLDELYGETEDLMSEKMAEIYQETYYKSTYDLQQALQIGFSFDILNKQAINKAMARRWTGSNYSDRIWANKSKLIDVIKIKIPQAIVMGENPKKVAKVISKEMGTALHNAERLARTEYLWIENEAAYDSLKDSGVVDKYQYLATLDNRTSEICQEMDGKIFALDKKQSGINYPPLHPNCRSTVVPYLDDKVVGTRIARSRTGKSYYVQGNMTYKEWAKKYEVDSWR